MQYGYIAKENFIEIEHNIIISIYIYELLLDNQSQYGEFSIPTVKIPLYYAFHNR